MEDDLKRYYNLIKSSINTIDENTFGIYVINIDSYVSSFIQPNFKRSFFSTAKKNIIDYISIFKVISKSNSNAVFGNFTLLESLFLKLLNPLNDYDIIQESWRTLLVLIATMINDCPFENYKTLLTSLFLITTDLENKRINLGSKYINISEVFTFEISYFHEFVLSQKNATVYFYFWQLYACSLMPIIIELNLTQVDLSQTLIITTLTYLNKYFAQNTNMYSHIGRIQTGRNEHIFDSILTQNILEFINIILNKFQITHNEEHLNLIIDIYIHIFPLVKAKSVYSFLTNSSEELELFNYIAGENERISFTIDHFVQCNSFDYVVTIIQHLMIIIGSIPRNHPHYIDLCLICKTLTSRFIFRLPVARKDKFFPSHFKCIINQSSLCTFFCFFLSVLYDVGHFNKDYTYFIAFLSQHFIDYKIYIYLVCKFTSQLIVTSFVSLFDIELNPEIKYLLSNPVIYETEKLKTKTLSEIENDVKVSFHDFYYLQPCSVDNSDFILDFLNFFGPSVRYLSSCVCCETIFELLSIMKNQKKNETKENGKPQQKSKKNFIEKLFHHLFEIYDKTDIVLCDLMNYIGNNFSISKDLYLKWLEICKKEICVDKPHNITVYKSMYFNLINLFTNGHFYVYKYTNELLSSTLKIITQMNINQHERNIINSYLFSLITVFKSNIDNNPQNEENKIFCSHIQSIVLFFNFELERKSLNLSNFISSDSFIVFIIKTKTYMINHQILDNFISLLTIFFDKSMKLGYEPVCFYNMKIEDFKGLYKLSSTVFETILCKISGFLNLIIYTNNFRNFIHKLSNFVDPWIIFHFILQIPDDEKSHIFETFMRTFSKSISYSHHDFVDSLILVSMNKQRQFIFTKKKNKIELIVSNDYFINKYHINSLIKHGKEIIQKVQSNNDKDPICMCFGYNSLPLLVDSIIKVDDEYLHGFDINSPNYYFSRLIASSICECEKQEMFTFSVVYNDCTSDDINNIIQKDIKDTSLEFRFFLNSLGIKYQGKCTSNIEGFYDNIKYKSLVHPLDLSSRDIKLLNNFVVIFCEKEIKEIKIPSNFNAIYLARMKTGFYKIVSHTIDNINIKIIPECLVVSSKYISSIIIEELVLWNQQLQINSGNSNNTFVDLWNDFIH